MNNHISSLHQVYNTTCQLFKCQELRGCIVQKHEILYGANDSLELLKSFGTLALSHISFQSDRLTIVPAC
jgi:hypothetical protein